MTAVCLDDGEIAGYLGRRLSPPEIERVEAHLDRCGDCRALVSELARDRHKLAASVAGGSEVTRHTTVIRWPSARHGAMDDEATLEIDAGQVIAGKYQFQRMIGGGAMGVVIAATHLQLGQLVALKFMNPAMLGHEQGVVRFRREARAAASLRNEHVGRVLDLGTLDSGEPFIVMEYLEGEDLCTRLGREGAIGEREALELILQACAAVGEAHRYGIVHRDLKPANLFLSRRGDHSVCLKVLDFGISKMNDDGGEELTITETDRVLGSPLYTAPEQLVSARDVDGRADIWSLGVILYQMIAGAMPYHARSLQELVARVMVEPPRSLASAGASASPAVEAAIRRCLERDVSRRFQTVEEFQLALSRPPQPMRRPPRRAIAIGAAGIATAAVLGIWLAARQLGDDGEPASPPREPAVEPAAAAVPRGEAAAGGAPGTGPAVDAGRAVSPEVVDAGGPPPPPEPDVEVKVTPEPRRTRPPRSRERPPTRTAPRPDPAPAETIGDDDILPPKL